LELKPISAAQLHQKQAQYRGGMSVVAVRPGSPAADQGIRPGDVLVGLHIFETISPEQVLFVLNRPDFAELGTLKFFILRNNESKFGYMALANRK
jgi:serine protease Do